MQNMNLSMTPYTQAGNFVCSQYDVGRQCQIQLIDENGAYTIPSGATVTVLATKPSGFGFSVACTYSGSTVTFTTTETMTEEAGRFPAELRITSGNTVLGTTNFCFKVEKSPHPNDVIDGDAETAQALTLRVTALETSVGTLSNLTTTEKGSLVGAVNELKADIGDLSELETTDQSSLVNAINEARGSGGSGVPSNVRQAMLTLFESAVYSTTGLTDEITIVESWATATTEIILNQTAISITGSESVQLTATTVPSGGTVVWSSSNLSIATVDNNGLVVGCNNGTATIQATSGDVSASCTVTVSGFAVLESITATYTQTGTVPDSSTLEDLIPNLEVYANYDNSTSVELTSDEYTLSGTLTEGTSTITVSYGDLTTTFDVTVIHSDVPAGYTQYDYLSVTSGVGYGNSMVSTPAQLNSSYTVIIKLKLLSGGGGGAILGTRAGSGGTKEFALWNKSTANVGYWIAGTDSATSISVSKDVVHTITFKPVGKSQTYPNNIVIDVDGTEYNSQSSSTGVSFSAWLGLLGYANSSSENTGEKCSPYTQLGEVIVIGTDNSELYHFVPCSDSNGKNGYYDVVNDHFYYNSQGSTTIVTAGNWE